MSRETVFHILITAILLALTLLAGVLPAGAASVVSRFLPALFFALIAAIVAGPVYAGLLGVLSPLLYYALFHTPPFMPETVTLMVSVGVAGVTAGVFYILFKTAVGAVGGGILAWLIAFGVTKIIALVVSGNSYDLLGFLADTFGTFWPGLVLTFVAVPVLTVFLRKKGVMWVLRHERKER